VFEIMHRTNNEDNPMLCEFILNSLAYLFIPSYLSAYEDGTECTEMSAYKIHTPGNYLEESIQHFVTYPL